ncbi:MAG: hypothetical protein K9K32_00160 [Halanaerobiales bacterium]|nr:hypothetical protein [Halanaerobiales bacterium]
MDYTKYLIDDMSSEKRLNMWVKKIKKHWKLNCQQFPYLLTVFDKLYQQSHDIVETDEYIVYQLLHKLSLSELKDLTDNLALMETLLNVNICTVHSHWANPVDGAIIEIRLKKLYGDVNE